MGSFVLLFSAHDDNYPSLQQHTQDMIRKSGHSSHVNVFYDYNLDSQEIDQICTQRNVNCPSSLRGHFFGFSNSPLLDFRKIVKDIETYTGGLIVNSLIIPYEDVQEYFESIEEESSDDDCIDSFDSDSLNPVISDDNQDEQRIDSFTGNGISLQ